MNCDGLMIHPCARQRVEIMLLFGVEAGSTLRLHAQGKFRRGSKQNAC